LAKVARRVLGGSAATGRSGIELPGCGSQNGAALHQKNAFMALGVDHENTFICLFSLGCFHPGGWHNGCLECNEYYEYSFQ
jgi:hypothetical protein